jgi:anti-anti-sigma factor
LNFDLLIAVNVFFLIIVKVKHFDRVRQQKESVMPATVEFTGSVARIALDGEFDFSSQENLNLTFEEALTIPANEIRIDLENTTFIDSSVIRLLLIFQDAAKRNQKKLVLLNCNERIYEILKIGGFDQIFDIQ